MDANSPGTSRPASFQKVKGLNMTAEGKTILTATLAGIGCVAVIAGIGSLMACLLDADATTTVNNMYGAASIVLLVNILAQVARRNQS